jgi:hypothetical protein
MSKEQNPLVLDQQLNDTEARISMRTRIIAALAGGAIVVGSYVAAEFLESRVQSQAPGTCEPTGGPNGECRLPPLPTK